MSWFTRRKKKTVTTIGDAAKGETHAVSKSGTVTVDASQYNEYRRKAKEYDKLTTGQSGAFLRKNAIIK